MMETARAALRPWLPEYPSEAAGADVTFLVSFAVSWALLFAFGRVAWKVSVVHAVVVMPLAALSLWWRSAPLGLHSQTVCTARRAVERVCLVYHGAGFECP